MGRPEETDIMMCAVYLSVRSLFVLVLIQLLALPAAAVAGRAEPTQWVAQPRHTFSIGDVVFRDAVSGRWTAPALPTRRNGGVTGAFLVVAATANGFLLSTVTSAGEPAAAQRAVLMVADHGQLSLSRDRQAFLEHLHGKDAELTVRQTANGFRIGDVVCLNQATGYLVLVPYSHLLAELSLRTPVFLVTEVRGEQFRMSRITPREAPSAATVARAVPNG